MWTKMTEALGLKYGCCGAVTLSPWCFTPLSFYSVAEYAYICHSVGVKLASG